MTRRGWATLPWGAAPWGAAVAVVAGAACAVALLAAHPASARESARPTASALTTLDTLAVKGRAPLTGYSREAFGTPWTDVDRNGCDTRNDILRRDLTQKVVANCVVVTGLLRPDPYTNRTIVHVAGRSAIDIDHVVSLADAWQKGAFRWSEQQRTTFANDPLNLLAVDASANRQKGDSDAASWLPPNKAYRCSFVARQVAVKARYGLWVTAAERAAIARVLSSCPGQPLPVASSSR